MSRVTIGAIKRKIQRKEEKKGRQAKGCTDLDLKGPNLRGGSAEIIFDRGEARLRI